MAGGKMTLNVNVIESREHLSSIDLLLAPSLVPARNGYRVTGELSCITDLPNGFLEKSCSVEVLQRKYSAGQVKLLSHFLQQALYSSYDNWCLSDRVEILH